MKKISLLFFASLLVLLTACPGSDDGDSPEDTTKKNLSVTWKVNATALPSSSPEGTFSVDYKEITLTFNLNGEYSLTKPDAVKFASAPANASTGKWKLSADLKQVIMDEGTNEKKLNISTLTATNFIFNFEGAIPPKETTTGTITYNMIP